MLSNRVILENALLQPDMQQRILFVALQTAVTQQRITNTPSRFDLNQLREQERMWGADIYLCHPHDVQQLFTHVTSATYGQIQTLYLERHGRTIPMVHKILNRFLAVKDQPPISYEAVWAVCLYLHQRWLETTTVTYKFENTSWQIIQFALKEEVWQNFLEEPIYVTVVINLARQIVCAYRISGQNHKARDLHLTLYDALVIGRRPDSKGAAGLLWSFPQQIMMQAYDQTLEAFCADLGINIVFEPSSATQFTQSLINQAWVQGLETKLNSKQRVATLFGTHLYHIHGHDPYRHQQQLDREYSYSTGFQRDPCWQFPQLKQLLPTFDSQVATDGSVQSDGLRYESEWLKLFLHHDVQVQTSQTAESTAWIYLDGEFLCEAYARELRRKDGSYRPFRVRR